MNTSKPISTISYNTDGFLKATLDSLVKSGDIDAYLYIYHLGEWDEVLQKEDKNHYHILLFPSRLTNTQLFVKRFEESVPDDKPLGVMPFRTSSVDDWILYNLHDESYLNLKFEEKQYHYKPTEIKSSNDDYRDQLVREAYHSSCLNGIKLKQKLDAGIKFDKLVLNGFVNPSQVYQYDKFAFLYKCAKDNEMKQKLLDK